MADRLPIFALSYLADALAASNDRGPRYQDVVRRLTNALRVDADRAHVEEIDDDALSWLWNSNVRATAVVLDGLSRRNDDATLVAPLVALAASRRARTADGARRTRTRWRSKRWSRTTARSRADVPRMTTTVAVGSATVGTATFDGRSTTAQQVQMPMPDLLTAGHRDRVAPALSISRTGTGRVYYTARLQSFAPEAPEAVDRGFRVERRYERYVKDGPSAATTSFSRRRSRSRHGRGDDPGRGALPRAHRSAPGRLRADRRLVPDDGERSRARGDPPAGSGDW